MRREELQRRLHRRQPLVVARDMQHGPVGFLQLGQQQPRVKALGRTANGDMLGFRHDAFR